MRYLVAGALPLSAGGSQDRVTSLFPAVAARLRGAPGRPSPHTGPVGALVSSSSLPAPSVNETRTLIALPSSVLAKVYVEPVAPLMSASPASHW